MSDRFNISVRPVKERKAWQVGGKLYKTQLAAAKAEAWSLLLTDVFIVHHQADTFRLSGVKKYTDENGNSLECECNSGVSRVQETPNGCPLHDRFNGLFRRMHASLTRTVLEAWGVK